MNTRLYVSEINQDESSMIWKTLNNGWAVSSTCNNPTQKNITSSHPQKAKGEEAVSF